MKGATGMENPLRPVLFKAHPLGQTDAWTKIIVVYHLSALTTPDLGDALVNLAVGNPAAVLGRRATFRTVGPLRLALPLSLKKKSEFPV